MNSQTLINPDASIPHERRVGRCYELTGRIALRNPHLEVVHGTIQGMEARRIKHAWAVLPDESVWEPATNTIWPKQAFYSVFNAIDLKRYANSAFRSLAVRHGNWGDWDVP